MSLCIIFANHQVNLNQPACLSAECRGLHVEKNIVMQLGGQSEGIVVVEGQALPAEFMAALGMALASGSSGFMNLPMKAFVVAAPDSHESDVLAFRGPARMRLARERSYMLVSLDFRVLNFDLVWMAAAARQSGEPLMPAMERDEHDAFTFILCDERGMVRGLRAATVAPDMGRALRRAQAELMAEMHRPAEVMRDLQALFAAYPRTIPDERFHEISDLGE